MAEAGRAMAGVVACMRALWLAAALLVAPLASAQELAPVPPLDSPVVDASGTLDAATIARLEAQALALQQRKGSQLQVLVVPTTRPEDIAQYAVRVYDQWRLGREGVDDGVLLVVAVEDRRVRIEVGYGLEGAIPDATAARVIQEYLVPRFRAGDYAGGIAEATAVLVGLVDGEPLPEPMARHDARGSGGGGGWLAGLFAAFIVAQVVRGVFSRAPRPLRGIAGAGAAGGAALLFSGALVVGGIGAMIGLLFGLASLARPGRYANDRGWGGGGWGGPPFGGGGFGGGGLGGGWGGGGGFSGGGGASGSW